MSTIATATRGSRFSPQAILSASRPLAWTGLAFLAMFFLCVALTLFDDRLLNGISVWIKPAKFYLSLSLHCLTVAAALLLLPDAARTDRRIKASAATMVAMMAYEMVYITLRAARGEASHFNEQTPLAQILYGLMGVGAVIIMLVTAYVGYRILRNGAATLLARATGWSFIAAAVLTISTAGTLSAMGSHWIGGDQTDATGLPIIGWSTTGGDLRSAHFFALHIMQAVPLAALSGSRAMTWAAALGIVAATLFCYWLALAGHPLIALR